MRRRFVAAGAVAADKPSTMNDDDRRTRCLSCWRLEDVKQQRCPLDLPIDHILGLLDRDGSSHLSRGAGSSAESKSQANSSTQGTTPGHCGSQDRRPGIDVYPESPRPCSSSVPSVLRGMETLYIRRVGCQEQVLDRLHWRRAQLRRPR